MPDEGSAYADMLRLEMGPTFQWYGPVQRNIFYKGYAMLESTVAGGAEETCNQASYIYVGHAFTTGLAYAAHHSTSVDVLSYNWGTVQGSLLDLRRLEPRK